VQAVAGVAGQVVQVDERRLGRVVQRKVKVTDLPDFTQGQVRDGIGARNLEDARNIVARLQTSATCASATASPSASPSASASPSGTATRQATRTPSASGTKKPTASKSASPTGSPSGSPSPTGTASPSPDDCDSTP